MLIPLCLVIDGATVQSFHIFVRCCKITCAGVENSFTLPLYLADCDVGPKGNVNKNTCLHISERLIIQKVKGHKLNLQ